MRRIKLKLSFPTLLFGMSFALCMVVALLFINRRSGDDAFEVSGASRFSGSITSDSASLVEKTLVSLPSDALPPEPVTYSPSAAATGTAAGTNILDQAVDARLARNESQNAPGETFQRQRGGGVQYPAGMASPAPAPPGYGAPAYGAATPNPYQNMSPEFIRRQVGQRTQLPGHPPYAGLASGVLPPDPGGMINMPPIAVPPEFQTRTYAPTPTPYATMPPARAQMYAPYQSNYGRDSIEGIARKGLSPHQAYVPPGGIALPPTNIGGPNKGLWPQQPNAVSGQGGGYLPVEQTLLQPAPMAVPTLTPPVLRDPQAGAMELTPAYDFNALDQALAPVPSLAALEPVELPMEEPLASPAVTPLPTSAPVVPTPTASSTLAMATTNLTPAQREEYSKTTKNAEVTWHNVPNSYARPNVATAPGKPDVQDALNALKEANLKASPLAGTASGAMPPMPTVVPPIIRPDGAVPASAPIDYARMGIPTPKPMLASAAGPKASDSKSGAGTKALPPDILKAVGEAPLEPETAARVGERTLSNKDASRRVDAMLALQGKSANADKRVTLTRLVAEEWAEKRALSDAARQQGVTVSDDEIRQFRDKARQRFGGNRVEDAFKSAGFSEEEILAEMRDSALCEKLVGQTVARKYDDAKLRAVYEADHSQFQSSRRLRVQEIVKAKPKDKSAEGALKRQMQDLQRQVVSGGTEFSKVASESSDAPSRSNGGDLGWLDDRNADKITPSMAAALEKLKPGQVSDVIEGADNFGIYRLVEIQEPKPGFEGARDRVIESLESLERKEAYEDARKAMVVSLPHQEKKGSKGTKVTAPGAAAPRKAQPSAVAAAVQATAGGATRSREPGQDAARGEANTPDPGNQLEELARAMQTPAPEPKRGFLGGLFNRDRREGEAAEVFEAPVLAAPSARVRSPQAPAQSQVPAQDVPQQLPAGDAPAGFGGAYSDQTPPEPVERKRGFLSKFRRTD